DHRPPRQNGVRRSRAETGRLPCVAPVAREPTASHARRRLRPPGSADRAANLHLLRLVLGQGPGPDSRVSERLVSDAAPSSYGFRIRSPETLRFVRSGGGQEPLEIVRAVEPRQRPDVPPLSDWPVAGADPPPHATLYPVDRGFEFWVSDDPRGR